MLPDFKRSAAPAVALAAALFCTADPAFAQEESTTGPLKFTFVHTSDSHVSTYYSMPDSLKEARSWTAVRTLKHLGSILLQPYGFRAMAPSFIVHTGDITEFGFAGVTQQVVDKYFGDLGVPVFYILGNHDSTWVPPFKWMEKKFGGINYSFDFLGVHFLGINTAGVQDPRPSIGQESINFVKRDLAKVAKTTPIIMFLHHPLTGSEWSSPYDYHRLLDAVQGHNVILSMDGHGHGSRLAWFDGVPTVMGGSPFSKKPNGHEGYSIVSLDGENLRVAYRQAADMAATKPLLERPIPGRSYHPQIVTKVSQTGSGDARQIVLQATVSQAVYTLRNARYTIDDGIEGPLELNGSTATASVPASKLESGTHYVRFTFDTSEQNVSYTRSMPFAVESGVRGHDPVAAWRYQMGGASRTKPLLHQGRLYIGGNDGVLYALDAATGKPIFTFDAKSPVTAAPAAAQDLIIFGAGDGVLRAVTSNGQLRWEFAAEDSIFGHPVVSEGLVYFACNGARVYCLDAATGQKKWEFYQARESVETQPLVYGGKVYFGAWDGNVWCVDAATGRKEWSAPGPRNQVEKGLPTYYAPADAALVAIGQKLYATDRAYHSGTYSLDGKYEKSGPDNAVAFAPAADGKHLYLRRTGAGVSKVDLDLNVVWESDVSAGALPYAPVESDGVVYGVTNTGTLYALDAASGSTLWKYRVTPGLYSHAEPTVGQGLVYTVGQGGVVTAVQIPTQAPAMQQAAARQ